MLLHIKQFVDARLSKLIANPFIAVTQFYQIPGANNPNRDASRNRDILVY